MHKYRWVLFILTLVTPLVACSSRSSDDTATNAAGVDAGIDTDAAGCVSPPSSDGRASCSSDGATANAADGNDAENDTDAAACVVAATSYDQTCQTAADCVGVPVGGNTCDPCHAGSGDFACPLAAINASARAKYVAALAAAFQSIEGSTTYQSCVVNACPTNPTPACHAGKCVVEHGVPHPDAGADARDAASGG